MELISHFERHDLSVLNGRHTLDVAYEGERHLATEF